MRKEPWRAGAAGVVLPLDASCDIHSPGLSAVLSDTIQTPRAFPGGMGSCLAKSRPSCGYTHTANLEQSFWPDIATAAGEGGVAGPPWAAPVWKVSYLWCGRHPGLWGDSGSSEGAGGFPMVWG